MFIDEIDKICSAVTRPAPDVSREGVQRDLLPLPGQRCTVSTKHGIWSKRTTSCYRVGAFPRLPSPS